MVSHNYRQIDNASASQSSNKRENKQELSGTNKRRDVRIENFDLSYADRWDINTLWWKKKSFIAHNNIFTYWESQSNMNVPSRITSVWSWYIIKYQNITSTSVTLCICCLYYGHNAFYSVSHILFSNTVHNIVANKGLRLNTNRRSNFNSSVHIIISQGYILDDH